MPVTVVVGGQFGSEGKGKVAYEFARRQGASVAVRTGGSNSGHTVIDQEGRTRIFRHLPTAAILPDVMCVIGPGTYLDLDVLLLEKAQVGLPNNRLAIDPNAVVVEEGHKADEKASGLIGKIGSTGSGTGAAVISRIARNGSVKFAKDDARLSNGLVRPVRNLLREKLLAGERVILEGTQGFGLSLIHSAHYPHVTSRDTTASSFISEAGLSPLDVDEIILVIRAFPIRVAGSSGPLLHEIDWETITRESGSRAFISERTTVTGNIRRIARFDAEIVRDAIECNRPTSIVLNHVDYVDYGCRFAGDLTQRAYRLVEQIEHNIERMVDYVGLGPASMVCRPNGISAAKVQR